MFYSLGTLKYSINPYKLIVEVDQELSDYYRSMVPAYVNLKKPMYPAHISVVRKETPIHLDDWALYEGHRVLFEYENIIYNDETYYWLNAWSLELEIIRKELGLDPTSEITYSPDGRHKFHITIGNLKK
jgi:hypothetical protein